MRVLLDTHAFLWWVSDESKVSAAAARLLRDAETEVYLSVASAWEIAIKARLGKLKIARGVDEFVPTEMRRNKIGELPVGLPHALTVATLPAHHEDPFDRLIVAQAMIEGMSIVSRDTSVRSYAVNVIW